MPVTTFVHDGELNQPTGDKYLDELLAEARARSGRDWQITTNRHTDKRLFAADRVWVQHRLVVYVGGVGPWQIITHGRENIVTYLLGYLGGLDDAPSATMAA